MPITNEDLNNRFKQHEDGSLMTRYSAIRNSMRTTAQTVVEVAPEGRELSIALTKLEEAMFWANAAIARNPNASWAPEDI